MNHKDYERLQAAAPGSPRRYIEINGFMKRLKKYSDLLTHQEFGTLRGQATHGDLEGAERGLQKILEHRGGI